MPKKATDSSPPMMVAKISLFTTLKSKWTAMPPLKTVNKSPSKQVVGPRVHVRLKSHPLSLSILPFLWQNAFPIGSAFFILEIKQALAITIREGFQVVILRLKVNNSAHSVRLHQLQLSSLAENPMQAAYAHLVAEVVNAYALAGGNIKDLTCHNNGARLRRIIGSASEHLPTFIRVSP